MAETFPRAANPDPAPSLEGKGLYDIEGFLG